MKTFKEVSTWCVDAAEEFGDPSAPIGQLFVGWHDDLKAYHGDRVVCGWLDGQMVLLLGPDFSPFPICIASDGPRVGDGYELVAFGADPVSAGVWEITPSLNVPGVIHAFLVFYDVPHPAPWERRIVLL
jgi:hypothetical protein